MVIVDATTREVKTLTGKLEDDQVDWHKAWRGHKPQTVRTVDQALAAIGALRCE